MPGGDIDKIAISEAFSKIKNDMLKLNEEMYEMKQEQKRLLQENLKLKQEVVSNQLSNNTKGNNLDPMIISQIVKETLKQTPNKNSFVKKINKKRKSILVARIRNLASQKNLTIPEIKDIVVDSEGLCSKATFYRYVDRLKIKGLIDIMRINETEVLVSI
ncbi:hypothetical protein HN789_00620 [archaeon]|nr:hypothetical protein [archaeon]MBT3720569.1 hypothetical protein [archaeon]MBT4022032.1 hypothetical protein [archaeon]MBT4272645.1 hypothetical protein [archaeon]MBT4461443.1 hypothetical protein [archaeon]